MGKFYFEKRGLTKQQRPKKQLKNFSHLFPQRLVYKFGIILDLSAEKYYMLCLLRINPYFCRSDYRTYNLLIQCTQ